MPTQESTKVAGGMVDTEATNAVGVASASFMAAQPGRRKIVLCPPAAGNYTVSIKNPAVLGEGWSIAAGQLPLVIDEETYGNAPQQANFFIGSAAFNVVTHRIVSTAV